LGRLGQPVHTTEAVFAEATHHLKTHLPALLQLLAALDLELIRLVSVFPSGVRRAAEIITSYPERADWGDASLLILSEAHPRARLVTADVRDFTVYRRWDGTAVPCIMPPISGSVGPAR